MEIRSPHLTLSKTYWAAHLKPGDIAIDATCGNGHDTLFLGQYLLSDPDSAIFAFDVQPEAVQSTELLLKKHLSHDHLERVLLHRRSHLDLCAIPYPYSPRLIVFNLGYLPGGNKKITTQTETTLESIKMGTQILADDGALSITCYPGHEEGAREEKALLAFVETLPSSHWVISYHRWISRPNSPTFLWIQQKKKNSISAG